MKHTRDLLSELAGNLRWIWNGEFDPLFRDLDPALWIEVNHNPTAFLQEIDDGALEARASNPHYRVRLERACLSLRNYVTTDRHWVSHKAPGLAARPIAYFSAEFGLHESLPIYSGGLGILAGDYLKSSSDLGLPIWGVTILYREGYFIQRILADGTQEEVYTELDLNRLALQRVNDAQGKPLSVEIPSDSSVIKVDLWKTQVGRANLLLLDGYGGPSPSDRYAFTRRLYGGDLKNRLLQELILGVGGFRALRMMGIHPGVLHLNEGHCAFAILGAIAQAMQEEGLSFDAAADQVRNQTVFTTHTPVAAGHDRFPPSLIDETLTPLRQTLGLSRERFLGLGRVNPADDAETFCMTVLALKHCNKANGVSSLHGRLTRRMWQNLWPARAAAEVPIGHITNGVHVPSWIAPRMAAFLNRSLGAQWLSQLCYLKTWNKILDADCFEIWDTKCAIKKEMLEFVQERLKNQADRLGSAGGPPKLNPDALTIGFARRFVEYKRSTLLFRDPERLARLLSDPKRPVQIIYAGKAHPNDEHGKWILKEIRRFTADPRFQGKVVLVENYDMNVSRSLLQGCDLWLNTPRRPLEACGTSGQKAIFNATLNLSTLDGWWAEAYDQHNGFSFGKGLTHTDPAVQDLRDADALMRVLENAVVPEFFERSPEDVPLRWVERIRHALNSMGARYNSDRMVMEYVRFCYLTTAGSITADFPREE